MQVTYTGPYDEVEIPALGVVVKRGETVDVPDADAGRPASVIQDDDGNDVLDPGEGLLAQAGNWLPEGDDPRTVRELKAYADEQGIDLGGATKKPDIVAVIRATENPET